MANETASTTTTTLGKNGKPKTATTAAPVSHPPPTLAVVVMVCVASVFLALFPPLSSVDAVATTALFTNRVFPDQLSLLGLAIARTACASLVFGHTIFSVFVHKG